ncbi:hypothetical protein J3R83DRAFT_7702 [Lanmaoa asiatica]|nr:hypothetical protein J3R83DRAFT_7702 [Lanmaoa asiatica]
METWPVSARSQPYLEELFETHDICPLPAFDSNGKLIAPAQNETMLQGAQLSNFTSLSYTITSTRAGSTYTLEYYTNSKSYVTLALYPPVHSSV